MSRGYICLYEDERVCLGIGARQCKNCGIKTKGIEGSVMWWRVKSEVDLWGACGKNGLAG